MKHLFTALLFIFGATIATAQPTPDPRKVQVAILFDTSGSMDGLIDQAKSRIWNIVNEIGTLEAGGMAPEVQFALYRYGNDGLPKSDNYIEQLLALTNDLDAVSKELFALTTNGGSEYCGAVIGKSLDDLKWSTSEEDLKMIYIAGNEPFNQGPVDFREQCKKAKKKGVFISTIHCGSYEQGVKDFWEEGATCSGGDYFNIDSDKEIEHIPTPYDAEIQQYNDSLNTTYFGYGRIGMERKAMQEVEDANATSVAPSVAADRAVSKSNGAVYSNESWDLLDGVKKGKVDLEKMKEEELPEEFKNKTPEERKALLEEKQKERDAFQTKIGELAIERENFINAELEKRKAEGEEVDDFGSSVNKSILEKAENLGFNKKTPVTE